MTRKSKNEPEDEDDLERAPWEDGALTVDVTSVPAEVVVKNCLSDDLPLRLAYIKGLASAATRANKRELSKLLGAVEPLLDDEALGVRLETLQQLQQLAKLADSTVSREEVEEAVVDVLEQQLRPSLDPSNSPGGGSAGTGALPLVRDALLAALDAVCGELPAGSRNALLLRLLRAANAALDKPLALGGGGKASGDASLMALSLAVVAVRHMDPDRGGLAMAAIGGRLCGHGDLRVREALAGALPQLYGRYAGCPGALEQMFETLEPLCNDKVWSVRQACARVVSELSLLCGRADAGVSGTPLTPTLSPPTPTQQQQRADELQVRLLRRLYLDTLLPTKSQWVVTAAREQAGAAIASLRPGGPVAELLPPLLDAYCAAAAAVGQGAAEVRRACAESFGNVVAKAGPERWPQLQPVFVRLLASNDPPTLCSLVASAERVVRLLAAVPASGGSSVGSGGAVSGQDCGAGGAGGGGSVRRGEHSAAAARQVVSGPLLEVLRNQLHLVAPAASAAMAGLLEVCPVELQREVLQLMPQLCEPPAGEGGRCGDWRPRLSLANQLHAATRAVATAAAAADAAGGGADATALVARCALALCGDPVWAVRWAAATQVGLILADAATPTPPTAAAGASSSCGRAEGVERTAEEKAGREEEDRAEEARRGPLDGEPSGPCPNGSPDNGGSGGPGKNGGLRVPKEARDGEGGDGGDVGADGEQGDPRVAQGAEAAASSLADPGRAGELAAAGDQAGVLSGLTERQRGWLDLVLRRFGSDGDAGACGQSEAGAAGAGVTAVRELAAWLRHAALQGTRAEQALAAACCQGAVPR
ncbi:hypothetical protein PLESTF_001779300 [Pleodorina starrii]|nr:hypothetical protein PLESTF_001779300 [Pleodorina starrii]